MEAERERERNEGTGGKRGVKTAEEGSVHSRISLERPLFDNLSNFAGFFNVFCSRKALERPFEMNTGCRTKSK